MGFLGVPGARAGFLVPVVMAGTGDRTTRLRIILSGVGKRGEAEGWHIRLAPKHAPEKNRVGIFSHQPLWAAGGPGVQHSLPRRFGELVRFDAPKNVTMLTSLLSLFTPHGRKCFPTN